MTDSEGANFVFVGINNLIITGTGTLQSDEIQVHSGTLKIQTAGTIGNSTSLFAYDGSTINLGNSVNLGPVRYHVLGGTTVEVDSGTATISSVINDYNSTFIGGLIKTGAGTLTLTSTNTYTGSTTISAGKLTLGVGGSIASSSGVNLTASGATFDISGAGNQTIQDLSGVTGSTVNLGANALTEGTANFSSFDGVIEGVGGSLVKQGSGTLFLNGANTYTGGTTINDGELFLGDGVTAGASLGFGDVTINGTGILTVDLVNGSTLANNIIDNNLVVLDDVAGGNYTVSGFITGTGSVEKGGSNTITMTGNNNYSGGTTIDFGTLVVGNASALGTGTVTQNDGVLRTDNLNHIVTMGNGFDQAGGTLFLNLNGLPGAANNDQVNITGTAVLMGNLVINYTAGNLAPSQSETYTVITTTAGITNINMAGYEPPTLLAGALRISITGQEVNNGHDFDVTLTATQTAFTALSGTNLTPNQQSAASYLDRFDTTVSSGPIMSLLQALDGVSVNPTALGPALDQLMPLNFARFTSSTAFNNSSFTTQQLDEYLAGHRGANGTFFFSNGGIDYSGLTVNDPNVDSALQMVHSRLLAWSPAPTAGLLSDTANPLISGVEMKDSKMMISPEPANCWNVFISGNVVLAQDFSDPHVGLAHADTTTGGMQLGADYRVTQNFLVGAMFGYGHTDASLDTLGSTASVDTYSPGVYASYANGGWYANALGSYGFSEYDQDRKVAIGAFNGTAQSSPSGDQVVGNLDGGYDFHCGPWTLGPTAGVQYVHLDVNSHTETGLPGANLAVNDNQSDSLRSRLGGRVAYAIRDGDLIFTPHLSASWQHEFLDQSRGVTSQFEGIGAGSFSVRTANPSRDSALADAGLDAQIDKTWTVFADYTVQAGQSNYFGQSVQAGVKIGF